MPKNYSSNYTKKSFSDISRITNIINNNERKMRAYSTDGPKDYTYNQADLALSALLQKKDTKTLNRLKQEVDYQMSKEPNYPNKYINSDEYNKRLASAALREKKIGDVSYMVRNWVNGEGSSLPPALQPPNRSREREMILQNVKDMGFEDPYSVLSDRLGYDLTFARPGSLTWSKQENKQGYFGPSNQRSLTREEKYGPAPKSTTSDYDALRLLLPRIDAKIYSDSMVANLLRGTDWKEDYAIQKNIKAHFYEIKEYMDSPELRVLEQQNPNKYAEMVANAIKKGNYYLGPDKSQGIKLNLEGLQRLNTNTASYYMDVTRIYSQRLNSNGLQAPLNNKSELNKFFENNVYGKYVSIDKDGLVKSAQKNILELRNINHIQGNESGIYERERKQAANFAEEQIRRLSFESPGSVDFNGILSNLEIFNRSIENDRALTIQKYRNEAAELKNLAEIYRAQGKIDLEIGVMSKAREADSIADGMQLRIGAELT